MSNELAIGAVTATLHNLLLNVSQNTGLSGASITTKPPDKARDEAINQINLFLYQVLPNAAWRNMDIPQRVKSGETSMPPLALNLYYMVTAYGDGDNDVFGHLLLGHAMRILYDNSVLGPDEIKTALASAPYNLGGDNSELQNQVERVRITLQPLSVEEIFRLWSGFLTQYRVSVAYEVAVVLIESNQAARTPLPVLTRGKDDRGITAQGDMIPPFPTLVAAIPPNLQTSVRLGDILTLNGFHLDVKNPAVRFTHTRLGITQILAPEPGTASDTMTVKIPDNAPNDWPTGFYTLEIDFTREDDSAPATTNELPLSLAPQIEATPPISAVRDANGNAIISLKCKPAVRAEQRVSLLVGDREALFPSPPPGVPPPPRPPLQDQLTFDAGKILASPVPYRVRLRVDGLDSLLVIHRKDLPPIFDKTQSVVIS